jgi:hypothetical protein
METTEQQQRNGVFCAVRAEMLQPRHIYNSLATHSLKEDAIQRGSVHGSRGIVIVGAVTRQLLVKTLRAGKDLACALVIC